MKVQKEERNTYDKYAMSVMMPEKNQIEHIYHNHIVKEATSGRPAQKIRQTTSKYG